MHHGPVPLTEAYDASPSASGQRIDMAFFQHAHIQPRRRGSSITSQLQASAMMRAVAVCDLNRW